MSQFAKARLLFNQHINVMHTHNVTVNKPYDELPKLINQKSRLLGPPTQSNTDYDICSLYNHYKVSRYHNQYWTELEVQVVWIFDSLILVTRHTVCLQ